MTQREILKGAKPDKGPVLNKKEEAEGMLLIKGQVGSVYFFDKRYQQEKGDDDGIIQRPYPEDPVAVEPSKVSGLSCRIQQPAGDQIAGKDKKEVYAGPTREKGLAAGYAMPDDDGKDGEAPETIQGGEIGVRSLLGRLPGRM